MVIVVYRASRSSSHWSSQCPITRRVGLKNVLWSRSCTAYICVNSPFLRPKLKEVYSPTWLLHIGFLQHTLHQRLPPPRSPHSPHLITHIWRQRCMIGIPPTVNTFPWLHILKILGHYNTKKLAKFSGYNCSPGKFRYFSGSIQLPKKWIEFGNHGHPWSLYL